MSEDTIAPTALARFGGTPRFTIGDAVRVRAGVTDPDFPDIPLTGWAGTVSDIDPSVQPPLYLVEWTRATLAAMPAVYRVRCERKDLEFEECWLGEVDLEPDPGGPVAIVPPAALRPAPLDRNRPDDRVRAIFGLTTDDPLPAVDEASLQRFHDHFSEKLSLPAGAHSNVSDGHQLFMIRRLLPVEQADEDEGLRVEVAYGDELDVVPLADLSLLTTNAVAKDLEAYTEWLLDQGPAATTSFPPSFLGGVNNPFSLERLLARCLLACVLGGALVGALVWTVESAPLAAQVGAGFLGLLGCLMGMKTEGMLRRFSTTPNGFFMGALIGFVGGALLGGTAGVLVTAYAGAIPGAIAGTVLGQLLAALGVANPRTGRLTLLGLYIGAMAYAFVLDSHEAIVGCSRGGGIGIGLFVAGYLLARLVFGRLFRQ